MASAVEAGEGTAAKNGFPLLVMLLGMVVTVLGSVGGAVYWLTRSGRLPVAGAAAAAAAPTAVKAETAPTRLMVLEPLLVNLADQGGSGYLRVVVALRVEDAPPGKSEKPKEEKTGEKGKPLVNEEEVEMRDAALTVLGRETSAHLLAPEGKEALKRELREAMSGHVSTVQVKDVLFTEFLVQR